MKRKIANAMLGLVAGIVSIPLIVIAWPFTAAWYLYNETED